MKEKKKYKTQNERIFQTLSRHPVFSKICNEAREKYLKKIAKNTNIFNTSNDYLEKETKQIMDKFVFIPYQWEKNIKEYIRTGELKPLNSTITINIKILDSGKRRLTLEVSKNTTRKEYLETWRVIKKLQKQLIAEFNPSYISEADNRIIEMYQNNTDTEISNELFHKKKEFYSPEKKDTPVESTIRSRASVLKKQLGFAGKKK